MKNMEFKQGQELQSIFFEPQSQIVVDSYGCKSITVSMENGQMAGVPWAYVVNENGEETKWNLALASGVRVKNTKA